MLNNLLIVALAIFFNVFAQCLMKYHGIVSTETGLRAYFSFSLFGAVVCYFFSFLFSTLVYKYNELSVASPVMGGFCFILLAFFSYIFFNESITGNKILGVFFITLGIYFLNK